MSLNKVFCDSSVLCLLIITNFRILSIANIETLMEHFNLFLPWITFTWDKRKINIWAYDNASVQAKTNK